MIKVFKITLFLFLLLVLNVSINAITIDINTTSAGNIYTQKGVVVDVTNTTTITSGSSFNITNASFLDLKDTPSTYAGSENFFVQVYGSALRFFDLIDYITTNFYNKTQSDLRYLQSFTESDPFSIHTGANVNIGAYNFTTTGKTTTTFIEDITSGLLSSTGNSNVIFTRNIRPRSNNAYDLGTGTATFRDLYLSRNISTSTRNFSVDSILTSYTETDPIWTSAKADYYNSSVTNELLSGKAGIERVARTIYVDADNGNDSNTGESWEQAFKTIQYAVDSVAIVIDNVEITIRIKGTFKDLANKTAYPNEDANVIISKDCFGAGVLTIAPPDYTSWGIVFQDTGANWITYNMATSFDPTIKETGHWNNSYFYVTDINSPAVGEMLKVNNSVATGNIMNVSFTTDFENIPAPGSTGAIMGEGILESGGWFAFDVIGGMTNVNIEGILIQNFDGEVRGIIAEKGATVLTVNTVVRDMIGGEGAGYTVKTGATINGDQSYINLENNVNNLNAVSVDNANFNCVFQCIAIGADGGNVYSASNGGTINTQGYVSGGIASLIFQINSNGYITSMLGDDGSEYGIRAETGSQVFVTGTSVLNESADAATFAYIS